MQTALADVIRDTAAGRAADDILRRCVHCGFCNATCPTYQLAGDELDGPRGRIYLMKQALEGQAVSRRTQTHLDRCLTCRACETTCPSGVQYAALLDVGRAFVDARVRRPLSQRLARRLIRALVPHRRRFGALLTLGQALRPLLPAALKRRVPPRRRASNWPLPRHARRVLLFEGCAQPALAPEINAAAARVLDGVGVSALAAHGCCGALSHHLNAEEEARRFMRANVDAWWPHIETGGVEAIVFSASGCGVQLKDYGASLRDEPRYAERAARVAALARDLGDYLADQDLSALPRAPGMRVAFHAPCTLTHGLKLAARTEALLRARGFTLTPVADAHLCCGSAGAYSLLEPGIAGMLRERKLAALAAGAPDVIASANIGCLAHLGALSPVPVRHWVELLDGAT